MCILTDAGDESVQSAFTGGLQGSTVIVNQPRFALGSRVGRQNGHETEETGNWKTGKIYSRALRVSMSVSFVCLSGAQLKKQSG